MTESVSKIDWSRATVTVRVPLIHTAMETWETIDVPIEALRRGSFGNDLRELVVVTEEQYERITAMLRGPVLRKEGERP